jgi:tetratricopeptide (TPR) repeat protein
MSRRSWLRRHYRNQPPAIRRVLTDPRRTEHIRTVAMLARAYPDSYTIQHHLVSLLRNGGRFREALIHWKKMVRRFPRAPNPFFQRAFWAVKEGSYGEAARWFKECLRRDRGYFGTSARFYRTECLVQVGRFDEAEAELRSLPDGYVITNWKVWCKSLARQQWPRSQSAARMRPNTPLERTRER